MSVSMNKQKIPPGEVGGHRPEPYYDLRTDFCLNFIQTINFTSQRAQSVSITEIIWLILFREINGMH